MKKTILVTGGEGFVGSNLCSRLVKEGHLVISLDNNFTPPSGRVEGVDYRTGHTKDVARLVPERPDLIYHLGEYSRVEKSLGEPGLVFDLNLDGTRGVVEYWRNRGCNLVYAGSSTKYGDGGLGRDQSPYAWSKAINTELVRNYADWYKLDFAIAYFYNVYGPGERSGAYGTVVEIFRQQYLKGQPLTVVSPGTQKRNFTHVEDIVEGLVLVGEHGEGDEFGLGAPDSHSVIEVAKMFGVETTLLPERQGNRMDAKLDTTKSRGIGWKPRKTLSDYIVQITQRAVV